MKMIVIQKGSFNVTQLENVSNVAFSSGTVTITYGTDQSASYAASDYMFQFLV